MTGYFWQNKKRIAAVGLAFLAACGHAPETRAGESILYAAHPAVRPMPSTATGDRPWTITRLPKTESHYTVGQHEIVIAAGARLRTSGMTTCSALIIQQAGKTLFTHVDANNAQGFVDSISALVRENFDPARSDFKITVVPGDGSFGLTRLSEDLIARALAVLKLTGKTRVAPIYHNFLKSLVVAADGSAVYQDGALPSADGTIRGPGNLIYSFIANARLEDLKILGKGRIEQTPELFPDRKVYYEDSIIQAAQDGPPGLVGIYRKGPRALSPFSE